MKSLHRAFRSSLIVFLLLAPSWARANQGGNLTSAEQDELRDAQDPSERIKLYLVFAQKRLNRFDGLREASPEAQPNLGGQLDDLLGEFISIDDELKDWIQYQYNRDADMRPGLRLILEDAPKQLQQLQRIQNAPGPAAQEYAESLRDAIANLNDTINGATQAFADQQKKFPEMQRETKADARAIKKARKEEAKRNKEEKKLSKKEKKLRKKHQKNQDTGDAGEN